jgi:UDP-glucose 4-epimerase
LEYFLGKVVSRKEASKTRNKMNVLVTGGAGYVGSVVAEELVKTGYDVIVYDSLDKGHRHAVVKGARLVQSNLLDSETLRQTLTQHRIDGVVHMAADSLVGESVLNPGKYYRNNVTAGLVLLEEMRKCGISKIVFSSTAAVYGEAQKQPIQEQDPINPTNPYGESKFAFERALHWHEKAFDIRYASLRYFNAAGATADCGEHHEPETHLIPIALQTAAGKRSHVEIFGDDYATADGTCVRDYIHVADLARAHVLALGILDSRSSIYNLGCGGSGYSVREVIGVASEITGRQCPVRVGRRRAGDPAVLIASSEKIKEELGWSPEQSLHSIIESAWKWMQNHPNGYEE